VSLMSIIPMSMQRLGDSESPNRCVCGMPAAAVEAYLNHVYARLPSAFSIRVFRLQAGDPGESVHGSLSVLNLSAKPPPRYDALSYTWTRIQTAAATTDSVRNEDALPEATNPPDDHPYAWADQIKPHHVTIDGNSVLSVTCNLYSALLRLRSTEEHRTLFVDALSIDQGTTRESLLERSRQIRLMGKIFRHANLVYADLGQYDDGATTCLPDLKYIANVEHDRWTVAKADKKQDYAPLMSENVTTSLSFWHSVIALCSRPWWKRLWALQEVMLPDSVQFLVNDVFISRPALKSGFNRLWTYHSSAAVFSSALGTDDKLRWQVFYQCVHAWSMMTFLKSSSLTSEGVSLLFIMSYTGVFQTTSPQDQIYALIGLGTKEDRDAITVDYEQSYIDLLLQFSRRAISGGNMQILFELLQQPRQEWLPSWVFDPLRKTVGSRARFQLLRSDMFSLYRAGGDEDRVENPKFDLTGKRLRLESIVLGRLKFMTAACPNAAPVDRYWRLFGRWCLEARRLFRDHFVTEHTSSTIELNPDPLWWTLTLGCKLTLRIDDSYSAFLRDPQRYIQPFMSWLDANEPDDFNGEDVEASLINEVNEVYNYVSMICAGSRLAISDDNRICLVSATAAVGDRVLVFRSIVVPHIIRACDIKEGEEDCARLVDTAYVHGIMDGELFPEYEDKDQPVWLI
jgi:hypothetical protein